jgi:hypothetical protein
MRSKFWNALGLLALVSMLVACGGAPAQAPAAPTPTEAMATEAPTTAATEAAPAAVENVQADMNNLFPNGIGSVDCTGVHLVVATQTGPQIAGPPQDLWKQ